MKGNFRLDERIGAGGMGVIYRACQLSLDKVVAVKVLHEHLAADQGIVSRFHREAHAAGSLRHPHTITIIDFGQTHDGMLFIAMEYLDGRDLGRILGASGRLPPKRAVHIAMQVLEALDEAHAEGIVHRDLKPENIVISSLRMEPDFVKVLDFGIAKIQDPKRGDAAGFRTIAGLVCGTPEYMAPEQIRGDPIDGRTDLYALGVVLFEMLTGQLPFSGGPMLSVATRQLTEPPPAISALVSDVPPALEAIVERLLSKDPNSRYPSARAVHAALLAASRSFSSPRTPAVDTSDEPTTETVSGSWPPNPSRDPQRPSATLSAPRLRRPPLWIVAIAAGIVAVSAALTVFVRGGPGSRSAPEGSEAPRQLHANVSPATAAADETGRPQGKAPAPPTGPAAHAGGVSPEAGKSDTVPAGGAPSRQPVESLASAAPPHGTASSPVGRPTPVVAARELDTPEARPRQAPERTARAEREPRPTLPSAATQPAHPAGAPKRARSEAEAYERKGHEAAKAGRWRDAIAAWLVANDLSPKPSTLLNVARGYLRLGSPGRACVYLQRYERAVGTDVPATAAALIVEGRCR